MKHNLKLGNTPLIWSSAIGKDGFLKTHHGANGHDGKTQFPARSFPLEWTPIPGAKSYALIFEDFDAGKVIGFPFVHWVVANIKDTKLDDNQSLLDWKKWEESGFKNYSNDILWQGHNSSVSETIVANNKPENSSLKGILPEGFTSQVFSNSLLFFGPYPPDDAHLYTVTVYGLDVDANDLKYIKSFESKSLKPTEYKQLNEPYYIGDLVQAMDNHIIDVRILNFKYEQAK
ncbi:YbhB/YbcL family Raf kinase inhibitor-like protein [[Mycoplasma] testudinis]|uniref:YbhB/YbcL family Raf kinase inhibitor-like protein n=1 Tax=[Mycoplasma] testudinis TaxID=33924 RepID=UPI0004838EF9|nr:YbhB/YbcL family Raf kinase inhibitor-like protein [[Mycoplasma] testudinis]